MAGGRAGIGARDLDRIHRAARGRKGRSFWLGFLDGILVRPEIGARAAAALLAEADNFLPFFGDPEAAGPAAALRAAAFSGQNDLGGALAQLRATQAQALQGQWRALDVENHFAGLCAGLIAEGALPPGAAAALQARMDAAPALAQVPHFAPLAAALRAGTDLAPHVVLLAGDGHAETGLASLGHVARPAPPITEAARIRFAGASFVLTGPMRRPRHELVAGILRLGGTVAATTSGRTRYLVVADTASKNWSHAHFGTKLAKAQALIARGAGPVLVTEGALDRALRCAEPG